MEGHAVEGETPPKRRGFLWQRVPEGRQRARRPQEGQLGQQGLRHPHQGPEEMRVVLGFQYC